MLHFSPAIWGKWSDVLNEDGTELQMKPQKCEALQLYRQSGIEVFAWAQLDHVRFVNASLPVRSV